MTTKLFRWKLGTRLLLAAPTIALCAVVTMRAARGAPAAATSEHTVEVDIVDTADKGAQPTRFTFALDESGQAARASMPIGPLFYNVTTKCDHATGDLVPTWVDLRQHDNRPGAPADTFVSVKTPLHRGARTVLATVSRPDGTRLEIAVRIR